MAKQFIISAFEEVFGEYILNISKENLKIAALRGQIKLENVQLDGDLIGSHVLSVLGLSSFGVLSCTAKSIKIHVPWKNLEKEPTKFEISGVHLICVPLTPCTANQMYGIACNNNNNIDPKCTLRTRSKRLILARMERNYWNGQIIGEGPVMKRIQRAVKDVKRSLRRSKSNSRSKRRNQNNNDDDDDDDDDDITRKDEVLEQFVQSLGDNCTFDDNNNNNAANSSNTSSFSANDLPELPRDWKVKLREKVLRNMEACIYDLHIRCEVPEHGLEFTNSSTSNNNNNETTNSTPAGGANNTPRRSKTGTSSSSSRKTAAAAKAFVIGFTLESLIVRTANVNWEIGSHDKQQQQKSNNKKKNKNNKKPPMSTSSEKNDNDHLGPNKYVVWNNKIGYFNNFSVYFDNDPSFLLSQVDALRGISNNQKNLSTDKILSRIATAMEKLISTQEPGQSIRKSFSSSVVSSSTTGDIDNDRPHQYICENLNAEVRVRTSDRSCPGPISCSCEVLPFSFTFHVHPNQFLQYQRLKAAMQSQRRFDTMLRQRPRVTPMENPVAWWKYAIACVTSRPNSRPWDDIKRIGIYRKRYIELVMKKIMKRVEGNGYHAGLSIKESEELLDMENILPIEALEAFHLVALRCVYKKRYPDEGKDRRASSAEVFLSENMVRTPKKKNTTSSNRFRLLRSGGAAADSSAHNNRDDNFASESSDGISGILETDEKTRLSLLDAMTLRLGRKSWFVDWKLRDATVDLVLGSKHLDRPCLRIILRAGGRARSFGIGKRDFSFAIQQCDMLHGFDKVLFIGAAPDDVLHENDTFDEFNEMFENSSSLSGSDDPLQLTLPGQDVICRNEPDLGTSSSYLDLPPSGTVCHLAAGKDLDKVTLSISAHPATLIWTTSLFDSIADFFIDRVSDQQIDLTQHIRNAATPLARKAQLALLSPSSLAIHLNVSAPKVWAPLVSNDAEGTLILDAGTLKMTSLKNEGDTEISWSLQLCDVCVDFARSLTLSKFRTNVRFPYRTASTVGRGDNTVVRPFSIDAKSEVLKDVSLSKDTSVNDPIRNIEVRFSPICLNLVDAEMLARLFGKWYARGLHRFRSNTTEVHRYSDTAIGSMSQNKNSNFTQDFRPTSDIPRIFSVEIEKIEMALEGHSKRHFLASDEKSMMSLDSAMEFAPPTRAYLVEVFQITIKRSRLQQSEVTRLTVDDASIIRLQDVTHYSPMRSNREVVETENCILSRSWNTFGTRSNQSSEKPSPLLQTSMLHSNSVHLDEVEVDIESVVLKVTPTTLKDCSKAFRKIVELAQLVTREMERKVHEEGRKARQKRYVRDPDSSQVGSVTASLLERPGSPAFSEAMTSFTDTTAVHSDKAKETTMFDSSILFKVTLHESTLLAGRPIPNSSTQERKASYAVIQVLSNALIMFQSIENPDATGTKTLHISVDNVSAQVTTELEPVSASDVPPMIDPTGAEFRVVYATENFGCVVSQDVSLDCDAVKTCMTPNDLSIILTITKTMFERLRAFGIQNGYTNPGRNMKGIASLIRYQKKGTGIATRIRGEIQRFSFVLLRMYKSHFGAPEFLDFNITQVKGMLEGCISALSGEISSLVSVNLFNSKVSEWEYVLEPFPFSLGLEQMPNELVLHVAPSCPVQFNLTGVFLRDLAEMRFDINRDQRGAGHQGSILNPSVLSTVGLRRATKKRSVSVLNRTGLDFLVAVDGTSSKSDFIYIGSGSMVSLDNILERASDDDILFSVCPASPAVQVLGEREVFSGLSLTSSLDSPRLFLLKPITALSSLQPGRAELFRLLDDINGRSDPESPTTEGLYLDSAYYNAEPVVEWCMQNQRLRSNVSDIYSLSKGRDLLCSNVWSPEDNISQDEHSPCQEIGQEAPFETDGPEAAVGAISRRPLTPERIVTSKSRRLYSESYWLRPYLKNDSPEWTDMTCMLTMARERVMLPDSRWMWVNDWSVDISGRLGDETDADGWSYEAEFETFSRIKRYYQRGDTCRRRRWIRTRIMKPPRLDDPFRQVKLVWETVRDENGCFSATIRSHVRVKNCTKSTFGFFVFSPSWDEDKFVGSVAPEEMLEVPILYASAVFMRLSKNSGSKNILSVNDCVCSDRFSIIPTGHTSSTFLRTHMKLHDVSDTTLHFNIELKSENGLLDIYVEPVLRVVNLLPCLLQCQVGQMARSRVSIKESETIAARQNDIEKTETVSIDSGEAGACTTINPWRRPHLSLRVPGYRWSAWKRIVNRRNDETWRPSEVDEESIFIEKEDAEYVDELKTIVRFDRIRKGGDPLYLILSVDCGHCPTIRIFSQYWIVDKTGFGCRFSEGFVDLMGSIPDPTTSRRSYLLDEEASDPLVRSDLLLPGYQWSLGGSGMSLYFSRKERITLSIEIGIDNLNRRGKPSRSKWISPLDISNVIPKTVFSVDEQHGPRRFELAIHVTMCPGTFARTKMISLLPRYEIVNLLHRELVFAQDGCMGKAKIIPSKSAMSFHWNKASMPPKLRLGTPSAEERAKGKYEKCFAPGRIQADRIGVTSLRLPTSSTSLKNVPLVVQTEVRLATKDHHSAVVIVIWSGDENSNALYTLRNKTKYKILCRQPLHDAHDSNLSAKEHGKLPPICLGQENSSVFECGSEIGPIIRSLVRTDNVDEFVWVLKPDDVACFGFDDPEKLHILEWTYVQGETNHFEKGLKTAFLEVDAMGSSSTLVNGGKPPVRCHIRAEYSTKVIEFSEIEEPSTLKKKSSQNRPVDHAHQLLSNGKLSLISDGEDDDDETPSFSLRIDIPTLAVSVIDNANPNSHGREILLAQFERLFVSISQTREGYQEFELRLMSFQADNHVHRSIHPVMLFYPRIDETEPLLHMSAVRRLQPDSNTLVFRYAAIRLLEVELYLDRRTAETIAHFVQPIISLNDDAHEENLDWVAYLTTEMEREHSVSNQLATTNSTSLIHTANSGRVYLEQLHLHPVRIGLTFTQEWIDINAEPDTAMIFQFIRGMASIANAPIVFTSFVVGNVFESPQALFRIISTHYSSQLTKQVFGILGSLAILGAPADFISNVGSGVRDFFYEPIQGAVHGPRQFLEGLEAGTQSLARGVFVGVLNGAANVTEAVNSNLAGLTADDDFIDERKAHQRMLTDAMSRGNSQRTLSYSLNLAYASIARGVKSGALGIVEQPSVYASKHGPVGFLKGIGKAIVGAVVKPVVGLGDGAVLVMNHVSDATSNKEFLPKIPKRLRRALPIRSTDKRNNVSLEPYDERAAKAQKIVTGGESVEDVYIGHVNLSSHLIISSEQCLWAIDRRSREPWCVNWEEISHFNRSDAGVRIVVFSQTGLKTYVFQVDNQRLAEKFLKLLAMQLRKMTNVSEVNSSLLSSDADSFARHRIPGIRSRQVKHVFGSCNSTRVRPSISVRDEIDLVEQCHDRVRTMDSSSSSYFKSLDEEAWALVSLFGHLFSGLSSRRCIVTSIINGTGGPIQIKSTKLIEGGSPCYTLGTREYDAEQGILHAGGVIILFGWGVVPNLTQSGSVFLRIETNGFVSDVADKKGSDTYATAMPGYQVGFLEKSYDDSGWWAKYCILVRCTA